MPLNFYQLYNLLNENTVSQELKRFKKEKPEVDELLKASYVSINQILPSISEKSLRIIANWLLFEFFKGPHADNMQKLLQNDILGSPFLLAAGSIEPPPGAYGSAAGVPAGVSIVSVPVA